MGTRAVEQGPAGERVAENVVRLRKARGMSLRALSERLAELGRPILSSGLSKIEQGERRVDVDDLVALAAALNVSPGWLLLPPSTGEERVALTDAVEVPAWVAWQWIDGTNPLPPDHGERYDDFSKGRPDALRMAEAHPAAQAARAFYYRVLRTVQKIGNQRAFAASLKAARSEAAALAHVLDQMEAAPAEARTLRAAVDEYYGGKA